MTEKTDKATIEKRKEYSIALQQVVKAIPYVGKLLDLSHITTEETYQTVKGIEENLAKLMKAFDMEYIRYKEYTSPIKLVPPLKQIESADEDAKKFYDEYKDKFDDIDKMINSLEANKNVEGENEIYKRIFFKSLRYYFENDELCKKAEKKNKEKIEAPADTSKIEGEFLPASLPADEVNIMEEIRNGFNNIMSAFASQAGSGPEAGEGKILTVSLTDENANNISTMIVNKMNEEKATEPTEKDKQGVTNDDLGIEIRDSKRSIISEIDSVKSALEALIKEIEKKAMTFDQIYKKLCVTIVREHRNATGRTLR